MSIQDHEAEFCRWAGEQESQTAAYVEGYRDGWQAGKKEASEPNTHVLQKACEHPAPQLAIECSEAVGRLRGEVTLALLLQTIRPFFDVFHDLGHKWDGEAEKGTWHGLIANTYLICASHLERLLSSHVTDSDDGSGSPKSSSLSEHAPKSDQ